MNRPPRRARTRPVPQLVAAALAGAVLLQAAAAQSAATPQPTLRALWSADVGAARGAPLAGVHAAGDLVLAVDTLHGVSALRLADGTLAWFVQLAGPLTGAPARDAGLITFGSGDHLLVVEAHSGRRVLAQRLPSPLAVAPVTDGERVYAPLLMADRLQVLELARGQQVWDVLLPGPFAAAPRMVDGRVVVVAGSDGLRGFVTDADGAGRQLWRRESARALGRLVPDGSRLLVATAGRELLCLEGASGRVVWRLLPGARLLGPPMVSGDVVAVGSEAGLHVVGRVAGEPLWMQPGERLLAAVDGLLVVRGADGAVLVRAAADGARLDAGGELPACQPLDERHAAEVRGGELRVWTARR